MTSNISAAQIFGDTLYLDVDSVIDDPLLRRLADCVRQLRPAIDRAVVRHGHGATRAALAPNRRQRGDRRRHRQADRRGPPSQRRDAGSP